MATVTETATISESADSPVPNGESRSLLPGVAAYLAAFLLLGWMFWSTLSELPTIWDQDPNYSHGFIVPIAFLLFAIRIWRNSGPPIQESVARTDLIAGAIRITAGCLIHYISVVVGAPLFDVIALVLMAGGAVLAIGGRENYRRYAFPLWFLVFMAPLPKMVYDSIAINMQQIASAVSAMIFTAFGIPVLREGCYLRVPGFQMEVGAACSGLRQLAAIVALSLAVGHLSQKTAFFKWSLGLLSVPIAIGANCIRVTLTGFILMWFGREWAEGVYHTMEGLAIVAVAAVLILLTAWWLSTLKMSNPQPEIGGSSKDSSTPNPASTLGVERRLLSLAVMLAVCAGGGLFIQRHLAAVEKPAPVPLQVSLEALPMKLGDWNGVDKEISERAAYGDQHVRRVYTNQRTKQQVHLWVIYSSHGLDQDHHPEVCMSVAGQREITAAREKFNVPGHPEPVLQYQFSGANGSQWVYYWYYRLSGETEGELDVLQRFYLRMHHRPSSATLQVFAPSRTREAAEGARNFVRLVDAAIQPHVGRTAVRGNRRKQVTVIRSPNGN